MTKSSELKFFISETIEMLLNIILIETYLIDKSSKPRDKITGKGLLGSYCRGFVR